MTRDDVVDMKDLLYLYGYLLMPETYSLGPNTYLADLNGDNQVDFVDATLLGTYLIDPSNNPHGIGQEIEAQLTASLSPDPTATEFFNEGHVWHTFTVQTNADSLQVTVNGPGTDVVLEIAGGRRPPGRSYCGPERSDSPSRPRRDGWKLHLAGCADGETRIVLADYATKEILGTPILSG